MSDYTYTVERGTLWRHPRPEDQRIGWRSVAVSDEDPDYPEVFRAAAAVLAPDDAVHRTIRRATSDPGAFVPREFHTDGLPDELHVWQAKAVAAGLLRYATGDAIERRPFDHAVGGGTDG